MAACSRDSCVYKRWCPRQETRSRHGVQMLPMLPSLPAVAFDRVLVTA
jgi:hypothetical protein